MGLAHPTLSSRRGLILNPIYQRTLAGGGRSRWKKSCGHFRTGCPQPPFPLPPVPGLLHAPYSLYNFTFLLPAIVDWHTQLTQGSTRMLAKAICLKDTEAIFPKLARNRKSAIRQEKSQATWEWQGKRRPVHHQVQPAEVFQHVADFCAPVSLLSHCLPAQQRRNAVLPWL